MNGQTDHEIHGMDPGTAFKFIGDKPTLTVQTVAKDIFVWMPRMWHTATNCWIVPSKLSSLITYSLTYLS